MRSFLRFLAVASLLYLNISGQDLHDYCAKSKIRHYEKFNSLQKVNYPGDSRIDALYYKLDIEVDYTAKKIKGVTTVTVKNLQNLLLDFDLDMNSIISVTAVKLNGAEIPFTHIDSKLNILLPTPLVENETVSVDVYYQGNPGNSGFGSFEWSSHNGSPAIWTLSEPYGASDWFPCKDTPADKVDSADVWITCSNTLVPVSNGTLVGIDDLEHSKHRYKWKIRYPIAQYLISMAITNYAVYTNKFVYNNGQDTMDVVHYNYPEQLTNSRKSDLDKTVPMLEVFSEKFGLYPFIKEKYGHAEFGWGGGMEHQTCTSMGAFFESIVSHELAHQWFGDKITCKDWQNIWLNEGFATYLESVYVEAKRGKSAYKNSIESEMRAAKGAVGTIYVQDISSVSTIFDSRRSYSKGGVVLHMLRGVLGTDTFFDVMYQYANDEKLAYNVATTEDFQAVAERVSGMDLNYFFQEWIYGENYPNYSVTWNYVKNAANKYEVAFTLSQKTNTNPKFFVMPVQVKINYGVGSDTTVTVFNDQQIQRFTVTIDDTPFGISVDPDNWILKDIGSIINSVDDYTPDNFYIRQNYPNPFNPSTIIAYNIPSKSNVKVSVYNSLGKLVANLVNQVQDPGSHEIVFDTSSNAGSIASGVYYYTIESSFGSITKKMLLIK